MRFDLSFDMDNDAFADEPATEARRILSQVSSKVGAGETSGTIRDINGNAIGSWAVRKSV